MRRGIVDHVFAIGEVARDVTALVETHLLLREGGRDAKTRRKASETDKDVSHGE